MTKYPSIYDIPMCNRGPNIGEDLKRILKAQIMMCEADGTDPDTEPFIVELKKEIRRLELKKELRRLGRLL